MSNEHPSPEIGSNKIKKGHNNYSLSIFITVIIGVGLGAVTIAAHIFSLSGLSSWLIDIMYGVHTCILASSLVSGNGYFYMFIDKLFNDKTIPDRLKKKPESARQETFWKRILNFQFFGILLGLLAAIGLTVIQFVFHVNIPFDGSAFRNYLGNSAIASIFSHAILALGNFSLFCGLGNRSGRFADYLRNNNKSPFSAKKFFAHKDVHYTLAILGGFVAGIVLIVAIIAVLGAATFTTGGALSAVILGTTILGSSASAAGYIGRIVDVLFDPWHWKDQFAPMTSENALLLEPAPGNEMEKETKTVGTWKKRIKRAESIGTIAGVIVGIGLAACLLIATPTLIAVLFPVVTGLSVTGFIIPIVIALAVGSFGGLGNRLGHMVDKFRGRRSNLGEQTAIERTAETPNMSPLSPALINGAPESLSAPNYAAIATNQNGDATTSSETTHESSATKERFCVPFAQLFKKLGLFKKESTNLAAAPSSEQITPNSHAPTNPPPTPGS
jgi:hypothetical protein